MRTWWRCVRRRSGGVDMGDDPGVTGDQNGIGKFHWSRSPAQVDSVRMGRFRELLFWYVPGRCGIGRTGGDGDGGSREALGQP